MRPENGAPRREHDAPHDEHDGHPDDEEPLTGGNVATSVVRVGGTVRKPAGPQTPTVHALLEHLRSVGFTGAPRSFGIDESGRHVLEYVPGRAAHPARPGAPPLDAAVAGRLARDLHDAVAGWVPPPDAVWTCPIPADGADLVIHNDLAPWNLVVAPDRLVIVDWDGAAPGTRTWDLAYLAIGLVPLQPTTPWAEATGRLRALADGYGLDEPGRRTLVATLARRALSMHALLERGHADGEEPWARLWSQGHGESWARDAQWCAAHADELRHALLS